MQKLEIEVVGLRKKGEKTDAFVKFKDNSVVLDKILDCQRSPFDKSGLGYKKEGEKSKDGTWSPKTPEAGPSTSKVAPHAPAHDKKDFGCSRMQQGVRSIPRSKLRKETTPRWNQSPRYESGFNGYCYFVLTLVIRLWIVDSTKEEVMEVLMKKLDARHVTKMDILLPPITH